MGAVAVTEFAWFICADAIGLMNRHNGVVVVVFFALGILAWIIAELHTDRPPMP